MRLNLLLSLIALSFILNSAANEQWNGAGYNAHSAPQQNTAMTLLSGLPLKNYDSALDIGCGSGAITSYIASHISGSALGIDMSQSMIDYAQKTYTAANLTFKVQDINTWSSTLDTFDLITAFNCLHWVQELQPVMNEIGNSLQKGGLFMAAIAHPDHFLYASFKAIANSPSWLPYISNPNQEPWYAHDEVSMNGILTNAGLTAIALRVWYKQLTFESVDSFIAFLNNWMGAIPNIQALPDELKTPFIEAVAHHFLQSITLDKNGAFEFESPILCIEATKI